MEWRRFVTYLWDDPRIFAWVASAQGFFSRFGTDASTRQLKTFWPRVLRDTYPGNDSKPHFFYSLSLPVWFYMAPKYTAW